MRKSPCFHGRQLRRDNVKCKTLTMDADADKHFEISLLLAQHCQAKAPSHFDSPSTDVDHSQRAGKSSSYLANFTLGADASDSLQFLFG